jgi:hypothetical protein
MCSNESYAPVCSSQERICRTFVVEDEEGNELRRFQINIAQFLSSNDVNISSIFSLMTMKGLSTAGKDYFIPLLNISYSVGQATLIIPLSELQEKKISVVELSNIESLVSEASSDLCEEHQTQKKHK